MTENEAQQQISIWLQQDVLRMQILAAVRDLDLPAGYVAAGFLRNLIWDQLHNQKPGAFNDIDIIYFNTVHSKQEATALKHLKNQFPDIQWDIKNQARMHKKHDHAPYGDCADAMSYWPEKETAIGVRLTKFDQLEFVAPWGLRFLFEKCITWNSRRPLALFEHRVNKKHWLQHWPQLTLKIEHETNAD